MKKLLASVEAGGTKFVCAVADLNFNIINQVELPTRQPKETLEDVISYFSNYGEAIQAFGIGSFGPIDINSSSRTYGYITQTPKKGWRHTDLLQPIKENFNVPISFTTDVNAAAFGEIWARKGITSLVYYTVGTGIGGGVVYRNQMIGDLGHLELGHIFVHPHVKDENYSGVCPFHDHCLEGMASGPSVEKRCKQRGRDLSPNHPVWQIEAYYLAQAAVQATLSYRPELIVFGGGVMQQKNLIKLVRQQFETLLNGYVDTPSLDEYLVLPMIDNNGSASIGNFALAKQLLD